MDTQIMNTQIELQINGKKESYQQELNQNFNIANLLKMRGNNPELVVIEYNSTILKKEDFAKTTLKTGDKVEIVQFVGGG